MELLTELSLKILEGRGITDNATILKILTPSLQDLPDTTLLPSLDEAVLHWIGKTDPEKAVLVYGDYDVDGIISTTLVTKLLRYLGYNVTSFVPHRTKHGYGLKLETLIELGVNDYESLIILDSGTSAVECQDYLESLNKGYLILDHHEPSLPKRNLVNGRVINTHWEGVGSQGLCTGFMAWLFAKSMLKQVGVSADAQLNEFLAAASIAIIADVCPLIGFNHTAVKLGLEQLVRTPWPGLKALLTKTNISWPTAHQIAWRVAPRLNAAGRIDDAKLALDLLLSERQAHAESLASILEEFNTLRKELQDKALASISEDAAKQAQTGSIILAGNWPVGIVGIIAGRLSNQYNVPVCVVSKDDAGVWNGSARSANGISLIELFTELDDFLVSYGGHAAAAGLHLVDVDTFREVFQLLVSTKSKLVSTLKEEATITSKDVNRNEAYALAKLGPFGEANPEPLLKINCTKIDGNLGYDIKGTFKIESRDEKLLQIGQLYGHVRNNGGATFFEVVAAK